MGFFESLRGRGSGRSKALTLYRRGMVQAKKHDHEGAIDNYSAAIDMSDALPDVQAIALYNRALVYAAARDDVKAVDDLKVVLTMAESPPNVKTAAGEKLKRINHRSNQRGSLEP